MTSAVVDPMEDAKSAARDRAPSRELEDATVDAAARLERDQLDSVHALAVALTTRLREQANH